MHRLERFEQKARALGADVVHAGSAPAPEGAIVCAAELAIAETGSVLVALSQPERAAAMLADHLWLTVPAESIVDSLEAALARVGTLIANGRPYVTLMSGPSRTADIERTLTIGVHGPRELTVVILER